MSKQNHASQTEASNCDELQPNSCNLTFSEEYEITHFNTCWLVATICDKMDLIVHRSKEKKGPDAKELLKKYGYA